MYCGYATHVSTRENEAFCIGSDSTDTGRVFTSENQYLSANSFSLAGFCFYIDCFFTAF